MLYIAHRGNVNGPSPKLENHPTYIIDALSAGYNVEVDIWHSQGQFILGHDNPEYEIDVDFLYKEGLWIHAKNVSALEKLLSLNIACFWHQNDDFTLTTNGFIWTYPGQHLTSRSIAVMPEISNYTRSDLLSCYGICSDYVEKYQRSFLNE